ncbi:glycosyltransferase family 1 protein [Flavobacterium petrolei]|uniref:Glycosyltransferase family 1 protein n=1 Tax=Flavobacterium petrolei TaxID=2259594 RepID=A0A482TTP3_9FLAO|nr:glycosyltransferase [Flavobacterium petrolei]RYJ50896.1 glycosyltransferase family 1 protein [Flavobacterium petrolei]
MKFAIITHVSHVQVQNQYFAYSPFVNEMNVWSKYIDKLIIVAPMQNVELTAINCPYNSKDIKFMSIDQISLLGFWAVLNAILKAPKISWQIFKAMYCADHIHLRCPGNIGLLGCFVQMLFPSTPKTAKYAGNWDPKSKQPWSYRLQKWILSNSFLTRNMQVLVYGEWPNQTKNIKSFFTATYLDQDILPLLPKELKGTITFVFVGTLVQGKKPLYAVQLVAELFQKGYDVVLSIYGEGVQRALLESYILKHKLEGIIVLEGNQNQEIIKKAYQNSHFVVLPSESEGWPKAIAEGMFWGCVPVATAVSCVPFMLDYGNSGILLEMNLEYDIRQLEALLDDQSYFQMMSKKGSDWSRTYTLDVFENDIEKLLQS